MTDTDISHEVYTSFCARFWHMLLAENLSERQIFRIKLLKVILLLFNDANNIETMCGAAGGLHTFLYQGREKIAAFWCLTAVGLLFCTVH
jgi:hypothetical protein